jgi:hypothetical protein
VTKGTGAAPAWLVKALIFPTRMDAPATGCGGPA